MKIHFYVIAHTLDFINPNTDRDKLNKKIYQTFINQLKF